MNIIGNHVDWRKLKGKENASMQETRGFGCLVWLEIGKSMVISGDYGLTTTEVINIETYEDGIEITTKNSIYLVNPWN